MIFALLSRVALAGCDATVTPAALAETLNEANLSYAAMDEEGFVTLAKRAESEVGCLESVLTPSQVAAWDRVDGLRAFVEGDEDGALAAFRAARALDTKFSFSERIAPSGGKLAQLYARATPIADPDTTALAVRSGLRAWVDGSPASQRPTEEPAVVQVGASESKLDLSLVVRPGDDFELPTSLSSAVKLSTVADDEAPATTDEDEPKTKRSTGKKPVVPLWIATGASALVAGGLFGAAAFTNSEFSVQPSEAALNTNHATYYGSLGMAGVTLVLAGVSIAVTL